MNTTDAGAIAPEATATPQRAGQPHLFVEMAVVMRDLLSIVARFKCDEPLVVRAAQLLRRFDERDYGMGEALFVLRARDQLAADTVMHWIAKASVAGVRREKLVDAVHIAAAMDQYPARKLPD
ncbi:MAG: hypothetical protein KJ007_02985 [Burkholderiales bacterium]|nr:hypothetical protein [Burkholderiales bacterium]